MNRLNPEELWQHLPLRLKQLLSSVFQAALLEGFFKCVGDVLDLVCLRFFYFFM